MPMPIAANRDAASRSLDVVEQEVRRGFRTRGAYRHDVLVELGLDRPKKPIPQIAHSAAMKRREPSRFRARLQNRESRRPAATARPSIMPCRSATCSRPAGGERRDVSGCWSTADGARLRMF